MPVLQHGVRGTQLGETFSDSRPLWKRNCFHVYGCYLCSVDDNGLARGVEMKRPMRLVVGAALLAILVQPTSAFQETTVGGSNPDKPAAGAVEVETPKAPVVPPKGLNLKVPELSIGKGTGTEVRIPGFGTVGVLPKLDFGLELLYGATESKGPQDKSETDDVQIRGTIKHRF